MVNIKGILLLIFIFSCSTTQNLEEREKIRLYLKNGDYQKSVDEIEKVEAFKKQNSRLLYFLEKGIALHLSNKFEASLDALEKAKEIHDQLYTESVSKKLETLLVNDPSDNYYGETYERSLIHYYLSLNHLLLFENSENQKNDQLFSSRAEIIAWDSYLKDQFEKKMGKAFFKSDLLSKIYGGLVHEIIATQEDQQIALHLYKDAKTLLFRNYNSYPSFNRKYKDFNESFKKLPEMKEDEVKKNFVDETIYQKELRKFLDFKISSITKQKNGNKLSIFVLMERGIIPEKKGKVVYFPLSAYINANPNDSVSLKVNNYGTSDIFYYAQNNLGFKRMPSDYSYIGGDGYSTNYPLASDLAITFEVPTIENEIKEEKVELVIYDYSGKEVKRKSFFLVAPLGDIAQNAIEENAPARNLRIGFRLASKYLAIIVSSFATYNALKGNISPGLASFLALTEFYLGSKVIEGMEKADLRYWSTLPQNIFFTDVQLIPGDYVLKADFEDPRTGEKSTQLLGDLKVKGPPVKRLAKYRIFH